MSKRSSGLSKAGRQKMQALGALVVVIVICMCAIALGVWGSKEVTKAAPIVLVVLLLVEWLAAARPFAREYIYFEGADSTIVDTIIPFYNEVSYGGVYKDTTSGKVSFVLRILSMITVLVAIFFLIFGYFFNGLATSIFGNHIAYNLSKYAFSAIIIYCIPIFYILSFIVYFIAFREIKLAYNDTIGVVTDRLGAESNYKGKQGIQVVFALFPVVQWIMLFIPGIRSWAIFDQLEKVETLNMMGIMNTEDSIDKYRRDNNLGN